jgi:Ser/Thr protein kinase RdoA (MazF antagonist)
MSAQVAELYGLGDAASAMVPAARGEQGVIWRLETSTGTYAVKEMVMRRTEEDVAHDVAFAERAAAGASTYDVARTVHRPDGHVVSAILDRQVRLMHWLDMAGPDPGVDPALVGLMLAELHAVGDSRTDEVHPWYTEAVGEQRWSAYVDALVERRAPVAERLKTIAPDLVAFEELLVPPRNLRTCHRDLWADNVRLTSSGRLCVFDWDNCGPADVDHELAVVLWEYGLDDADRIRALRDTYVEAGGPGRITGPGDFTMLIAQFGHFYEMAVTPFLELASSEADRRHGVERFDEFDSRPLTMDAIARIVAVCSAPL